MSFRTNFGFLAASLLSFVLIGCGGGSGSKGESGSNNNPPPTTNPPPDSGPSTPVPSPTNEAPIAHFIYSESGLEINFDAAGSSDPESQALTFGWDFGDGSVSNQIAPTHTYMNYGSYTVTLTVSDGELSDDFAAELVLASPSTSFGGYPGVPNFTDRLPTMPAYPVEDVDQAITANPNQIDGWPYDPLELEIPSPTGADNEYVISVFGDDVTAGNAGKGTEAEPRRTIPEGVFPAGTKLFVIGDDSPYAADSPDFNMSNESDMTFNCTDNEPCWWVGIDTPRIGRRMNILNSEHLVLDGLSFVDIEGGSRPYGQIVLTDSEYITTRNIEIRGDGLNLPNGGALFSITGTRFLVTYNSDFHSGGKWDCNSDSPTETCTDVHGWRPLYRNEYLWLLDSRLYHLQGDGVQNGNSNNQNPSEDVSRFIYIAGNTFYENYENALDNKNSYHVIFSSNRVHSLRASDSKAANNTAIILSNNTEGPFSSHHWAINNLIWDTGTALRDSGTTNGEKNFMVGNVVWDVNNAFNEENNAANRESWIIHNTAYDVQNIAVEVRQPSASASTFVRNNIIVGGNIDGQSDTYIELVGNIIHNATVNEARMDLNMDNYYEDPLFADAENQNFMPADGSSAVNARSDEDPVFALFQQLYGLNINVDINGVPRGSSTGIDIGAIENNN